MDDKNVKKKGKSHTENDEENADTVVVEESVDVEKKQQEEQVDYKDKYLRALADYHNLVKRAEKEKQDFVHHANERLLMKLLDVLDDFERALQAIDDTGIKLIYKKLDDLILSEGVERIEITENEPFNPDYMHCIEAEPDGKRMMVVRNGYRRNGKVIRAAQVKVTK